MTATVRIPALTAMVAPERIAEIEITGIGRCTDGRTGNAADNRTGTRAARHRPDGGTGTRTEKTARNRTIARRRAATGENKSRRHRRAQHQFLQEHHCLHSRISHNGVDNGGNKALFRGSEMRQL
jgi:hypothetical protein